ncbi:MAG: hypothetical protein DMD30_15050 [Gemmatimonadetes bacterium]|nr:MAG: hypothetical protein DMD30_15050 [Gemmatimonadota bacterium]
MQFALATIEENQLKNNLTEKTPAAINESNTFAPRPSRVSRTIGLTEQRLRAHNKQFWMLSAKGWADFFGRFVAFAKG